MAIRACVCTHTWVPRELGGDMFGVVAREDDAQLQARGDHHGLYVCTAHGVRSDDQVVWCMAT